MTLLWLGVCLVTRWVDRGQTFYQRDEGGIVNHAVLRIDILSPLMTHTVFFSERDQIFFNYDVFSST